MEPLDAQVQILDAAMNVTASQTIPSQSTIAPWTFNFDNVIGRYIRIWKDGSGELNLVQVEVFGTEDPVNPSNLALGPIVHASQLRTCAKGADSDGMASRAIDGDTSGKFGAYTCTCKSDTEYENGGWSTSTQRRTLIK